MSFPKACSITGASTAVLIELDRDDPAIGSQSQALFERNGTIRAWDPAFLDAAAWPGNDIARHQIFDILPQIDAAIWASVWVKIDAGFAVLLRLGTDGVEQAKSTTSLVIHKSVAADGDLAAVALQTEGSEIERKALYLFQHEVLEAVASGWSLKQVADLICRRAEELVPGVVCSVLALDSEKRLRPLAAPSLPDYYSRAIDGLEIGPSAGSCGTAAYRGEPVIVTDIATDPLWADFQDLPLPRHLKACWSSPIKGRNGKVAGTFAFYYQTSRGPDIFDRELVDICVHLCAIAIEHDDNQSRIQQLALSDALTGLPNRAHFQQHACDVMKVLPISQQTLAILYIDLDEFKAVNDTLGHWAGDLLLKAVSDRFKASCRTGEFVARLGGDEFAVLQFPVRHGKEIEDLADRILACFAWPFDIDDHKITIGASIGIAQAPENGSNFIDLLRRADVALYHAKLTGGGTYHVFTAQMDRDLLVRRTVEDDLRGAIAAGEIAVYFQPIIDLDSGITTGFEALARWLHPKRGVIGAAEFIGLAEHSGIIGTLGNFILAEACSQAAKWPSNLKVAVNLAPSQLTRPNFVMDVVTILAASGLAPHRLELEITESVRLVENHVVRKALDDLKMLGIAIALDDFGTGNSSLSYLRAFAFDKVKIDLSFICDLREGAPAQSIVDALIALAGNLGMTTTAEGVEADWQRAWLQANGCTEAQGYFFGHPMPAADVLDFLKHQTRRWEPAAGQI